MCCVEHLRMDVYFSYSLPLCFVWLSFLSKLVYGFSESLQLVRFCSFPNVKQLMDKLAVAVSCCRDFSLCLWCLFLPLCCLARKISVSKMVCFVSGSSPNNCGGGFVLSIYSTNYERFMLRGEPRFSWMFFSSNLPIKQKKVINLSKQSWNIHWCIEERVNLCWWLIVKYFLILN